MLYTDRKKIMAAYYTRVEPETLEQIQAKVELMTSDELQKAASMSLLFMVQRDNQAFYEDGRQTENGMYIWALSRRLARELGIDPALVVETEQHIWRRANPGHNVVELKR